MEVHTIAVWAQMVSLAIISIPTIHWARCRLYPSYSLDGFTLDQTIPLNTTVLLPMRNEARRLQKKIERVLNEISRHPNVNLLIVDTGSEDGTSKECIRVLESSNLPKQRWEVIRTNEPGKSRGVNLAISDYPNDVIIMMDTDTKADGGWLEKVWSVLADRNIAVISGVERHERIKGLRNTYKINSDTIRIAESEIDSTAILEGGLIAWRGDYMEGFRLDESMNADDTQFALEAMRRGYRARTIPIIVFEDTKNSKFDFQRSLRRSQGLTRALTRNIDLCLIAPRKRSRAIVFISLMTYLLVPWFVLIFVASSPMILFNDGVSGGIEKINYVFFSLLLILPQGRSLAWGSVVSIISHIQYVLGINHSIWDPGRQFGGE